MFKFIEKNRIYIGIILILIILAGSFLLILQQQKGNIFCSSEEKIIDTLNVENANLKNKINDLENLANNQKGNVAGLSTSEGENSTKININTADLKTLDSLPGIGTVRAQQIIDYRNSNSGFKNIEEIKKVSGIGESTYNKLKDQITIN